ncbi:MAG: acetamidase [Phycisphaeraceae bacterium]|nr:acetamidase [Phycisphaeraceae bacterium]
MKRQPKTPLYYAYSRFNEPTMTVDPGEWFEIETQMNRGPDAAEVPDDLRDLYNTHRNDDMRSDRGNPTSGAIVVRGAKPGDMLTVHIGAIETIPIGFTRYRGDTGAMPGWLGPSGIGSQFKLCRIENGRILWNDRLTLPVRPMLGCVGLAPASDEARHNGWAAEHGGNMDIQEVTTGARVHLPVNVEGALLQIGDMHAIQGDGEICGGGGIETGGTVQVMAELSPRPEEMTWPRIENDTHVMTTGIDKPAEDAFRIALSEMVLWLETGYGMPRGEAFMLLAQCLEARVTQFVNPTYTYLCKLDRDYLP